MRQLDQVFLLTAYEPGRQHEEIGTDRFQGGETPFVGKTQTLEPMDDVGRKQNELKKGDVGCPIAGRNLCQGVIVNQFADMLLDIGPNRIEQINAPSAGFQICDEDMIGVFLVLDQFELFGLYGIVWDRTAHDHEAVFLFPLVGLPPKLAHLPAILELGELAGLCLDLDWFVFLGHDHVPASFSLEEFDHTSAVESRIHAEPNARFRDGRGDLGQTDVQEMENAGRGTRISWPQRSVPEFLESSLEAEQRMIRPPSGFLRVVPDKRSLVFAVDHKNGRVDVEDKTGAMAWKREQMIPQAVVQSNDLTDRVVRQSLEETAQSRLIGKTLKSQHGKESSIVMEDVGLVDAA